MGTLHGKTWKFGHHIDTDIIIPARHLVLPLEEMKNFAMAPIQQDFARRVRKGDIIVAGRNFGCGSSREQAPAVLKALGIKAIVAQRVARIFFRNAINLGMVVIECEEIHDAVQPEDIIEIDPGSGQVSLPEKGMKFPGSRLPEFLLEIVAAGGLIPHLTNRLRASTNGRF